jgi:hypothetical protein
MEVLLVTDRHLGGIDDGCEMERRGKSEPVSSLIIGLHAPTGTN